MNSILKRTHIKANIDLLKARDFYFDIAKSFNLFKTGVVLLPSLLLLATYILSLLHINLFSNTSEEIFIGVITLVVVLATHAFDYFIQKNTSISNQLRAIYDHKVLGVSYNPNLFKEVNVDKYLEMSKRVKYSSKYEVWYSEVFSENHYANVFCCQLDNLLYAKHAYKKAKNLYIILLTIFSIFVLIAILLSVLANELVTTLLIVFSVSECYDVFLNKISDLQTALETCTNFCNRAKNLKPSDLAEEIIEQAQDIVNKNRDLCIFLPRIIRKQFLEDDNPFYRELNNYKSLFMGEEATIPETAEDIEVVFEDGSDSIPLSEIQNRLSSMLENVTKVLDDAGIDYTLDGGTLIGAMRNSTQGFIPWDDDIDIAINIGDVEYAKLFLREKLNFVIQDTENEPFYSPRLSVFKVREQNEYSMISEKDSLLYKHYKSNGIFIDVYAISPILISKTVDKIFRRIILHPINRKLEILENTYPKRGSYEKQLSRFSNTKKCYIAFLNFYKKHAKNTKYYAYFPNYIHDLKKAGPYHLSTEIYDTHPHRALWESKNYKTPSNPDAILSAYYGKDWKTPPYCSKKELIEKYGASWYSKAPTKVTALKHISNILSYTK